jgi:hypothetical protein
VNRAFIDVMAALLDLSNIVGGFLLAAALVAATPSIGGAVARAASAVARFAPVVGVVALVAGGYYVIEHATSGPHLFHFELVGVGVGVALLWDRLTGRPVSWSLQQPPHQAQQPQQGTPPTGAGLLLAVFGLIAIVVGVQGLVTPN